MDFILKNKDDSTLRVHINLISKESYELFLDFLTYMEETEYTFNIHKIDCFFNSNQLARMRWILESMETLGIPKNIIHQTNTLTEEEEDEMLGNTKVPWKYIGTVKAKNIHRCLECRNIYIDDIDKLK